MIFPEVHHNPLFRITDNMSGQDSEGHLKTEYGRRLVPVIIDEAARDTPDRTYAAIPRSSDLSEGFQDITYKRFANAINRVSFWLDSQFGKSDAPETFAYAGPKDLRYTILTVAAIKTGCEVRSGRWSHVLVEGYAADA